MTKLNRIALLGMMGLLMCCNKPAEYCLDTIFSAELNSSPWAAEIVGCTILPDQVFSIVALELHPVDFVPDLLIFRNLPLEATTVKFDSTEPQARVSFNVMEELDAVVDRYLPTGGGESWITIESVDLETNTIQARFNLKLVVQRMGGPLNKIYGDTVVFTDGFIRAQLRN